MSNFNDITTYIGLGSNLQSPKKQIILALKQLNELEYCQLQCSSSLYLTKPVGYQKQADFINCVAKLKTQLNPFDLLGQLQLIENKLGRKRTIHWGPRVIDLDILLYGKEKINSPKLEIPHKELYNRAFALQPIAELEPHLTLPNGDAIQNILTRICDSQKVVKLI